MKHLQAVVSQRRALGPALWELRLSAPGYGDFQPGQFYLVAGLSYLRRPLFPARRMPDGLSVSVRASADPLAAWLVSRAVGDVLDLLGPFGHGFAAPKRDERWLLMAESAGDMGPLWQQIELAVAAGAEVIVLTGGVQADAVFPAVELPLAVEMRVATADGSLGTRGSVCGLLRDALAWADRVAAAGSRRFYAALQREVTANHPTAGGPGIQVLLADVPLVCGVGACLACAVHGEHGMRLACQEGPVFDLDMVGGLEVP
jgi:dihydroorotate dehydrogenase electron transfer subunit